MIKYFFYVVKKLRKTVKATKLAIRQKVKFSWINFLNKGLQNCQWNQNQIFWFQ
jgi:hypothetical protein